MGPAAVDNLNKFVVWMALPALLFQAMADITWEQINQPGYVAASTLAIALVFAASCALDRKRAGRLADVSLEGLAASYSNAGFMGIPLCIMVFGPESLPAVVLAILLTACVLFAFSIVLIEVDLHSSESAWRTARKVGNSLLRNPLVVAPVLGAIVAASQIPLPYALRQFTTLLGAAASPCALITIGLFLAQSQPGRTHGTVWRIVWLKLILHPLITFILVRWLFPMPPLWANTAILLSALPVGTGPFMLAKLYDREPAITSRAILFSTVLSVATVSVLVAALSPA
jgi:predicted permease